MLRVNNLTGFGGRVLGDIEVTDDGDHAPSSGTTTASHTYSTKTSTGPATILVVTWDNSVDPNRQTSGVTWNAVAMSLLVQTASSVAGCAIYYISGAQSGDIVVSMTGNCRDTHVTVLSLTNLSSGAAVDTDSATGDSETLTLSALTSPGKGGVRICGYANQGEAGAITWTWTGTETEAADVSAGFHRHGVAYKVADEADNISADGDGTEICALAGVSLR